MSIEAQADNLNQDGSITIKVDGKEVKFVKEADLGAVKVQLKDKETEVTTLQTKLADANTKFDTEHQEVLKVRTASEQFEKDAGKSATLTTEVEGLKTEVASLKTASGEKDTQLTERLRNILTTGYKIDAEKIKDMSLEDLKNTEKTLILTGVQPAPALYDGKGAGGDGGADALKEKSPLGLFTMGYEQSGKNK